jgi:hypothetical protein
VLPLPAGAGTDISRDLGLGGAVPSDGRVYRHERNPPRAMMVDVRVEMWTANQSQLASAVDDLFRRFPGRGSLLTTPALLAADVRDGDTTIRLLSEGEPLGRSAWALLEAADSLVDRASEIAFTPTGAFDASRVPWRFGAASPAIRGVLSPTPLVPSPLDPDHPAPRGLALAVGFALVDTPAAGQSLTLCSLDCQGQPALRLGISFLQNNGGVDAEIAATATFQTSAGAKGAAVTRWRVPATRLASRVILHATATSGRAAVDLYLDGDAQPPNSGAAPITAAGIPFAGNDMPLTVGDPAGSPVAFDVSFVHLFSEPVGPLDPVVRTGIVAAPQWTPGGALQLATSDDGITPGATRISTTVESIDGDTLSVFPPITGAWSRGKTIVYSDEYFLQQAQFRRKDDLVNHLYRATTEYRVSARLDDDHVERAAQIVEGVTMTLDVGGAAAEGA